MCLLLSPTGHSQRLGIPSSLAPPSAMFPPSEIPVMAHQLLPSAPSYLRTYPSLAPFLPSPNDPQSQPRATYKYNARSVHDVLSTRLAFPNSVMTASVRHSVTSRGPMPAGSGGDALMPEPGAQSDAFPSHVC